jgi:hypothetical protein
MQVGEPLASDGPIMEVTARIRIMRATIAKATSTFIEMNTGSFAIFTAIRRASSRRFSLAFLDGTMSSRWHDRCLARSQSPRFNIWRNWQCRPEYGDQS